MIVWPKQSRDFLVGDSLHQNIYAGKKTTNFITNSDLTRVESMVFASPKFALKTHPDKSFKSLLHMVFCDGDLGKLV